MSAAEEWPWEKYPWLFELEVFSLSPTDDGGVRLNLDFRVAPDECIPLVPNAAHLSPSELEALDAKVQRAIQLRREVTASD